MYNAPVSCRPFSLLPKCLPNGGASALDFHLTSSGCRLEVRAKSSFKVNTMSQHTKRVVVLFSLLISISLLSVNSYGQGGSAAKTPPPSTKQPTKSSQPVKRATTSSRGSRSTSAANESDNSSATLEETMKWIGGRLTDLSYYHSVIIGGGNVEFATNFPFKEELSGSPSYHIDGCALTVERAYKRYGAGDEGRQYVVIPFADIDPRTIRSEGGMAETITMQAVNPTPKLLTDSGEIHSSSIVRFWLYSKESRKSFERAVRHAVKLCGGKASPQF